jgi:hypothetical protein
MVFQFGIEHEVAFLRSDRSFADFSNTTFEELDAIVQTLPNYAEDRQQLHMGDAGIRLKRWYIEGYERFSETGALIGCTPKGIEIRTTIHTSIAAAVAELQASFAQLQQVAIAQGFMPVNISFNPHQAEFVPIPPLNSYERNRLEERIEERTDQIPMMTYGPDLNLSCSGMSVAALIDYAEKLTFYSPFIVPFTFSAPFYRNEPWDGFSIRTFRRTGARSAAIAYVETADQLRPSDPPLTQMARLPSEVGRIEFKACDSCGDFQLYQSMLALLKGLWLDCSLPGRAIVPDPILHQAIAHKGILHPWVNDHCRLLVEAAQTALSDDADRAYLLPLINLLKTGYTQAHQMLQRFSSGVEIIDILSGS